MYRGCLPTETVKKTSGIAAQTIIRHVRGDSHCRRAARVRSIGAMHGQRAASTAACRRATIGR